jgi:hypothetical protein
MLMLMLMMQQVSSRQLPRFEYESCGHEASQVQVSGLRGWRLWE